MVSRKNANLEAANSEYVNNITQLTTEKNSLLRQTKEMAERHATGQKSMTDLQNRVKKMLLLVIILVVLVLVLFFVVIGMASSGS
jgi:membrane protein required for beta-lactamase induction